MPPPPHTKPENVLKVSSTVDMANPWPCLNMPALTTPGVLQRSQELIAVGQASAALTILHEHVNSKRSRNSPISSLEPVMIQFVELCVDLKKGKLAKDGLYQYKNTAQNTNVGTIEVSDLRTPPRTVAPSNPLRRCSSSSNGSSNLPKRK